MNADSERIRENDEKKEQQKEELRARLSDLEQRGVELYLDNCPASPNEVVSRCLQEQLVYMPDYVMDRKGGLAQIRYDRIRKEDIRDFDDLD